MLSDPARVRVLLHERGEMSVGELTLIVGSGGAAFSAAIAARRTVLRVVMIERGTVGGT